jgi:hypothetical protein
MMHIRHWVQRNRGNNLNLIVTIMTYGGQSNLLFFRGHFTGINPPKQAINDIEAIVVD